jgi:osmotically-inducible protein OsmY
VKTRPTADTGSVPNDAHLIGLVRGALGRDERTRHLRPRPNVSSCGFVVALHGHVADGAEARALREVVGKVPGVEGVEDKLTVD